MIEPIHLFRPLFRVDETLEAIRPCLERGWTGIGYLTLEFEQAWKQYAGLPHAHMTNSATAGLHLALEVLKRRHGWQDGDEVITTPLTFVSTNHAILYAGLRPVFADVDEFLCLDICSAWKRVTERTRAIMFVGMGGSTGDLLDFASTTAFDGMPFILDAAHMAGTRLHGQHVGREADAAVFSFQAVKNCPTADAGMVCFADEQDDKLARQLSWLGIDKDTYTRERAQAGWKYDCPSVGYKYHGNSIAAAMGLVSLKYLEQDNAYRRQLAAWYDSELAGCDAIQRVPVPPDCESSRHLYQVLVENRDDVIAGMQAEQVFPGVHYRLNTEFPMYQGDCPNAERVAARVLSLPLHCKMTREDVTRVSDVLKSVVR